VGPRRTAVAAVVALVVVAGLLVAVTSPWGDDGASDRAGPPEPGPPGASVPPAQAGDVAAETDLTIGAPEGAYRIDYRVEVPGSGGPATLDQVLVDLPFRSRLEIHPPGGGTPSLQIGTLDRLLFLDAMAADGGPVTIARVPALAPSAIRLGPVLPAAEAAGVLESRGQREVAGRRCQVVRTEALLEAGPMRPLDDDGTHVDTCVDAEGLVLEEVTTDAGEVVLTRTAVLVAAADADDALFETGPVSAPPERGGGATTPADPATAPDGPVWALPATAVPQGFEPIGRFSVVPAQPERFAEGGDRDSIIAGIADVWASEVDVLVVYQGRTLGGVGAFAPVDFAEPVDVPLGPGELLLSALGSEVRVALPEGRFVHVFGSLSPAVLLDVTAALEEGAGTGLELLEG
jgi:hypothetical protein